MKIAAASREMALSPGRGLKLPCGLGMVQDTGDGSGRTGFAVSGRLLACWLQGYLAQKK
jgi:hypothetical protein